MQITIESTPTFALVNDLPVRIWTGKTSKGTRVDALVVRVGVPGDDAEGARELAAELLEPPSILVEEHERPTEPEHDAPTRPEDVHYEAARLALEVLDRISQALIVCDGLPKDPADPFHLAVESVHGILTGAPPLAPAPGPPPSWLVRDFWILYRTAKATLEIETVDDAVGTRGALREQIRRLAPAFDTCEQERRGAAPSRLTAAERDALAALHRWLHSPSGDCPLIDAAQAFHNQVEAESPESCTALEAEERAARSATLAERSDIIVDQARKVFAGVGVMGFPGSSEPPPPVLSARIVKAIIEDPRASGDDTDPHEAAEFLAAALRGSQYGWLARRDLEREAWPGRLEEQLAKVTGTDRTREAWRFGFETALSTPEPGPDEPFEELDAVELTDAMREYAHRTLYYYAPERLSPRERAIVEAVQREDAATATSARIRSPSDRAPDASARIRSPSDRAPNDWKPAPDDERGTNGDRSENT